MEAQKVYSLNVLKAVDRLYSSYYIMLGRWSKDFPWGNRKEKYTELLNHAYSRDWYEC